MECYARGELKSIKEATIGEYNKINKIPSLKLDINLHFTYKKFHCNRESYRFSS